MRILKLTFLLLLFIITSAHAQQVSWKTMNNRGNTFANQKEVGKAIVMYKRALLSQPRNEDIRYNLALAQNTIVDDIETNAPAWNKIIISWTDFISMKEWTGVFLLVITLLNATTLYYLKKRKEEWLKQCLIALTALTLLMGVCFYAKFKSTYIIKKGIIIVPKIAVKSGPSQPLPTLFYLHQGIEVTISERSEKWSKIKLKNGFSGWVKNTTFWELTP